MWQPEPGWQRLPGGPSSVGLWLAREGERLTVVKRLAAPHAHDPDETRQPDHPAYWRRAADVALSGIVDSTPGLRSVTALRIEEDEEGVTLVHPWVEKVELNGLFLARSLGRFADATVDDVPWLARNQLGTRLGLVARRGGWTTLARTPVADVADLLWRHRTRHLERLASHRQVVQHGDPVPANLLGREGDDVVAIDWSSLGIAPAGADLGYLALSVGEEFDPLLDAYVGGLGPGHDAEEVRLAAQVTAVYTVLTRVDWALARVASGEGALAAKFRHPSIAPYIRAMQRQFPQIEALTQQT
ncbi:phosphotransferase family protein [Nocardioides jishulii]|uniref:Phosphotransferase n=1 Tax=Nocardioides jishulii TaxID=2575440 RepID=A0A4U2YM45_9ACTN|nr:phosphotransferase [Nocardioides jishulii]QCX27502.1 phosphotransferase [Nocardioides jishulii]TKI62309.1 phosphotransferase [Nocardioides jishulii]